MKLFFPSPGDSHSQPVAARPQNCVAPVLSLFFFCLSVSQPCLLFCFLLLFFLNKIFRILAQNTATAKNMEAVTGKKTHTDGTSSEHPAAGGKYPLKNLNIFFKDLNNFFLFRVCFFSLDETHK